MARRNTALMVVPPRLSPERRKLAEAIEQHRIATEEFDATNTALSRAEEGRYEARTRLEEAEAVVESAAQANADHAVDMAMGRRKKPPLTPQAAAQARDAARDNLAAARDAIPALQARVRQAEANVSWKRHLVHEAVKAVLKAAPEVAALASRVARLQRELADCGAALLWLDNHHSVDVAAVEVGKNRTDLPPAAYASMLMTTPPTEWGRLFATVAGAAPWQAAVELLQRDATTPLPT